MRKTATRIIVLAGALLSVMAVLGLDPQDKYTLKVPGGAAYHRAAKATNYVFTEYGTR